MLEGIKVLNHSSIKINKNRIIYIDPYKVDKNYKDADIVFITHSHYDHFSEEDINKIKKIDTKIVAPEDLHNKILADGFKDENIMPVKPNENYIIDGIEFKTVASYNIDKPFHPKENNWVGYIININEENYYIAGDTDLNEDVKKVKCDMAFVPVGGTYTMTHREAADLVNIIKPKIAVPIHYGSVVGTIDDAKSFVRELNPSIQGLILMH